MNDLELPWLKAAEAYHKAWREEWEKIGAEPDQLPKWGDLNDHTKQATARCLKETLSTMLHKGNVSHTTFSMQIWIKRKWRSMFKRKVYVLVPDHQQNKMQIAIEAALNTVPNSFGLVPQTIEVVSDKHNALVIWAE